MAEKRFRVVAAVISRDGRYLITQRRAHATLPLLWEFPGGRVEDAETDEAALVREVRERLGVDVHVGKEVRRVVHLRNSAHSVVKLMNPCAGRSLLVSSYTHPEYAHSMAETGALTGTNALLLRGTEGEAVADARRAPRWQAFVKGQALALQEGQSGSLSSLPDLPVAIDAASTAAYISAVLDGTQPLPEPIALQVQHLIELSTLV